MNINKLENHKWAVNFCKNSSLLFVQNTGELFPK